MPYHAVRPAWHMVWLLCIRPLVSGCQLLTVSPVTKGTVSPLGYVLLLGSPNEIYSIAMMATVVVVALIPGVIDAVQKRTI